MYAIIRAGGKQAKVRSGDVIDIERIKGDATELTFEPLLVVDDDGNAVSDMSALAKAKVIAKVLGESNGPKVDIFKYKNKTGYRRRQGHRQKYTQIEITGIEMAGAKKKAAETKKAAEPKKEPAAKKPAAKTESAAKKPAAKKPAAKKPAATKESAAKKPAAKKPAANTESAAKKPAATKKPKAASEEE